MNNCKLTSLKLLSIVVSLLLAMQATAAPNANQVAQKSDKTAKKVVDKKASDKKIADKKAMPKKSDKKSTVSKKTTDKKVSDKKTSDKQLADKKLADKKSVQSSAKKPSQKLGEKTTPKKVDKKADKPTDKKASKPSKTPIKKSSDKKSADKKPKTAKSYGKKYAQSIKHIPSDHLKKTAKKHGIDPLLVKAIIKVESGGRPNVRSPKGAIGLMQVMPATARQYGRYNLKDPKQNITVGVRHFASLKKRYKNTKIALAAYNAGEGNVDKYGGIPPFKETKRYVANTMATYHAYKANAV